MNLTWLGSRALSKIRPGTYRADEARQDSKLCNSSHTHPHSLTDSLAQSPDTHTFGDMR